MSERALDETAAGVEMALLTESVDTRSVAALRGRVRTIGQHQGLNELTLMKFVLVVHELAVNAVRHGGGHGEVRIWLDASGLCCEVTDHGRGIAKHHLTGRRRVSDAVISGRGLWLVRQICSDVRMWTGRSGTRVTVCFPTDLYTDEYS